ncbi:UNKNOWN [Stylonychia lemnae]|uniref:Uncharacterized protein n=1 Tax=Stylonychia lemnae TaxID=5949 RepID=A0A078B867_STYLE|nr:UNKNOWN [Stylonychia lemnae]|eukprot:CDW89482.1 UNKNOWN [Stylonychia lemnae]
MINYQQVSTYSNRVSSPQQFHPNGIQHSPINFSSRKQSINQQISLKDIEKSPINKLDQNKKQIKYLIQKRPANISNYGLPENQNTDDQQNAHVEKQKQTYRYNNSKRKLLSPQRPSLMPANGQNIKVVDFDDENSQPQQQRFQIHHQTHQNFYKQSNSNSQNKSSNLENNRKKKQEYELNEMDFKVNLNQSDQMSKIMNQSYQQQQQQDNSPKNQFGISQRDWIQKQIQMNNIIQRVNPESNLPRQNTLKFPKYNNQNDPNQLNIIHSQNDDIPSKFISKVEQQHNLQQQSMQLNQLYQGHQSNHVTYFGHFTNSKPKKQTMKDLYSSNVNKQQAYQSQSSQSTATNSTFFEQRIASQTRGEKQLLQPLNLLSNQSPDDLVIEEALEKVAPVPVLEKVNSLGNVQFQTMQNFFKTNLAQQIIQPVQQSRANQSQMSNRQKLQDATAKQVNPIGRSKIRRSSVQSRKSQESQILVNNLQEQQNKDTFFDNINTQYYQTSKGFGKVKDINFEVQRDTRVIKHLQPEVKEQLNLLFYDFNNSQKQPQQHRSQNPRLNEGTQVSDILDNIQVQEFQMKNCNNHYQIGDRVPTREGASRVRKTRIQARKTTAAFNQQRESN